MPNQAEMAIMNILQNNMEKNFIQRLFLPKLFPRLDRPDLGPGKYSSHIMSSAQVGDKHIAFPQVVYDSKTQKLNWIKDWRKAVDHALRTNEYISFNSKEEADWFGKNYKSAFSQEHFK